VVESDIYSMSGLKWELMFPFFIYFLLYGYIYIINKFNKQYLCYLK